MIVASVIFYLKEPSFDVVCSIAKEANLYPDFTMQQLMDGYNSEIYSSSLNDSECMLFINGRDFSSVLKDLFDEYGVKLQYCISTNATDYSAIELKEMVVTPDAQKTGLNLIDFSLRAYKDGNYHGLNLYMYFDISQMGLEVKGRCSAISNIRVSGDEIENTVSVILYFLRRFDKEIPDSAFDNILKLMPSDDVKLVSKPAAKTKFKVF